MGNLQIDLNCDLGENYGTYQVQTDTELLKYISSANVACGFHAGDPAEMNRTVSHAHTLKVGCGAHPGYPDLMGFGRRNMVVSEAELECYLIYQIGALRTFCEANNTRLSHVKVHGSLYLKAVEDESTARAVASAIASIDPSIICFVLAGEKGRGMVRQCTAKGLQVAFEGFPNRAYGADGNLLPRDRKGAIITDPDEIVERAIAMILKQFVQTVCGDTLSVDVNTINIPGEIENAVEVAKAIRQKLLDNGMEIVPIHNQMRYGNGG